MSIRRQRQMCIRDRHYLYQVYKLAIVVILHRHKIKLMKDDYRWIENDYRWIENDYRWKKRRTVRQQV